MDLQLLAKAKLLLAATENGDLLLNANDNKSVQGRSLPPKVVPKGGFPVCTISGSSLVNTPIDLRLCVKRGGAVQIDGVMYLTSLEGEWSSSCIQLNSDYTGATNFDARLTLPKDAPPPRYNTNSDKIKTSMKPVASVDIGSAVNQLASVQMDFKKKKEDLKHNSIATTFRGGKSLKPPKKFKSVAAELLPEDDHDDPPAPLFPQRPSEIDVMERSVPKSLRCRATSGGRANDEAVSALICRKTDCRNSVLDRLHPSTDALNKDYSRLLQEASDVAASSPVDAAALARRRVMERKAKEKENRQLEQQLREEEFRLRHERDQAKVKLMQARTQQRVLKLKEEAKRREQEEREREEKRLRELKQREEEYSNVHYKQRIRNIRREAANRMHTIEQRKLQSVHVQQAQREARLREIRQRVDRSTTYVPRLDNPESKNFSARSDVLHSPKIITDGHISGLLPPVQLRSRTANEVEHHAGRGVQKNYLTQRVSEQGESPTKKIIVSYVRTAHNSDFRPIRNGSPDEWSDVDEEDSPPTEFQRSPGVVNSSPNVVISNKKVGQKISSYENKDCEDGYLSDLTPEPSCQLKYSGGFTGTRRELSENLPTQQKGGMYGTLNEPSPGKPKKKRVWKKLAPIPISVPYQPTINMSL